MLKKDYSKLLSFIISISYILTCLLLSIHFWCFFEPFYSLEHSYLKLYDKPIYEHIGISENELKELTHFTLSYLNDPEASLDLKMKINGIEREVFTDDEKAHMVDVRNLNLKASAIWVFSNFIFSFSLAYYIYRKKSSVLLFNTYKKVLFYISGIFGLLGLWIIMDFDSFWTNFHHVFFPSNDLWILNLRKDILIMIVPPQFFNHLVLVIFTTFITLLIILYFSLKLEARKKLKND